MSVLSGQSHRVVIIGGGFTGGLFALKLAAEQPDWQILLIERRSASGRGVAYGDCAPHHLLNVPVNRMEVGLDPSFADWLRGRPALLGEALDESRGNLGDAFVPRHLFGGYIEQHLARLCATRGSRIRRFYADAVRIDKAPRRVILTDGSAISVDTVVLATGNLPPRLPFSAASSNRIIVDPWRAGVLDDIHADDSLLLLGSGLTMIDMLTNLQRLDHKGPVHAVSRHGLLPRPHRGGGFWPGFLDAGITPRQALAAVRANVRIAENRNIPWQRVFDAARPAVASLWHGWTVVQRAQFLRHLRSLWDVHRHRMPERTAAVLDDLLWNGTLTLTAGRVLAADENKDGLTVMVRPRGEKALTVEVDAIINCTGPLSNLRKASYPLFADLFRQGLARSDALGLGLDTEDCAVVADDGAASKWIFALGALTRPAWFEITAVPEINAQVERLVERLARDDRDEDFRPLTAVFLDIGAGI